MAYYNGKNIEIERGKVINAGFGEKASGGSSGSFRST